MPRRWKARGGRSGCSAAPGTPASSSLRTRSARLKAGVARSRGSEVAVLNSRAPARPLPVGAGASCGRRVRFCHLDLDCPSADHDDEVRHHALQSGGHPSTGSSSCLLDLTRERPATPWGSGPQLQTRRSAGVLHRLLVAHHVVAPLGIAAGEFRELAIGEISDPPGLRPRRGSGAPPR